ncbi:hypothetical protein PTTG_27847 [Puccinia triticina 1-1 BBBD Race 1]|uniref:DUF4219 domain-containing protein n=1 Tax=Puccinia triticina (isolate 1-1 / race 1 (BBBD)) TaxID=630390 RepID=A0A180GHF3_PUCT1|nr:hypothetical protein PTTG_27847 [Puccinia triticina 1-1 BBBD Race 1]
MLDVDANDKSSQALIGKLDNMNFPLWCIQMRTYLKSKDLWEICSGESVLTASKKKVKNAANILISHLSKVALKAVITPKNKDKLQLIWDAIVDQYASASINHKARIWLKFMRYEYGGDLKNYLIDFQKMIRDFSIVQLGILDDIVLILILAKLTKDCWNVFDNIIMNNHTICKLQELVYMKETRAVALTSKIKSSVKIEKDLATAYKMEAKKSKRPKPANPCYPGKHNPLPYHPAWWRFNLTAKEHDTLHPANPKAHLVLVKVTNKLSNDEDEYNVVEAAAFVINSSNKGSFFYTQFSIPTRSCRSNTFPH